MDIRKTEMKDIEAVMQVINKAKNYLKQNNIDQWQEGYPCDATIKEDIDCGSSYVGIIDGNVVGTIAITFEREEHYDCIRDGQWRNKNGVYGVIHRIAVDDSYKGKGIALQLMNLAEELADSSVKSIRIDTHKENKAMQAAIKKAGFEYCGLVTLPSGGERMTFEKLIEYKDKSI